MNRLLRICIGAAALVLAVHSLGAAERPNVIFFLVDDYDKPETSVYGGKVLTPNLDRMAKEGLTFHNAHMSSTVCTPSRYTCLTGRYASSSTAPVFLNEFPEGQQTLPGFNVALETDNMNVGAVLAKAGYATGYVGKYHVGGGDHGEGHDGDVGKKEPYSEALNKAAYKSEKQYRERIKQRGFTWAKNIYWGNMANAFKGHNPEWTISAALEFIDGHKDKPFYLHYCTTLLHGPNKSWFNSLDLPLVTGEGMIKEPLDVMPSRQSVKDRIEKAGLTPDEAGYLWMDDSLGMILDRLDKHGIADNTIIVFTADHGSRRKGSLYAAGSTSVPCIVRWPKGIKAGQQSSELIQNCDFVPTWFELAGVNKPSEYRMDGVSLAPLFKDPAASVRDFAYCEMGAGRSIKTKEWSYISLRFTKDQIAEMGKSARVVDLSGGISRGRQNPNSVNYDQLYRLTTDPLATRNLADNPEYAPQLKEMKDKLTTALRQFPNRPYGEFVPGGNAVAAGSYDEIMNTMRELRDGSLSKDKKTKKKDKNKKDNKKR
jgi:arylsulfatase A-like enzyme